MKSKILLGLIATSTLFSCDLYRQPRVPQSTLISRVQQTPAERMISEAHGTNAVISTQGRTATTAAELALKMGGNVIDAAVAASFAISVERPQSTGLGGGGFMLYRKAGKGSKPAKIYAIDFRERAPLAAKKDMYLNAKGEVIKNASVDGALAVAVPGFLPGMLAIHKKFGSLPLKKLLQPAIDLAENGVEVYPYMAAALEDEKEVLARFEDSKKIFLHPDGTPYKLGEKVIQKDLAETLRKIANAKNPARAVAKISQAFLEESKRYHGILAESDFKDYQVKWREPVHGTFKGYEIVSMPPPSSGGTHVIEILNILEKFPLHEAGFQSVDEIHWVASASQLAFADRAQYMGDPEFVKVPSAELISKSYADRERARIDLGRHIPSDQIQPGNLDKLEPQSTTHLSIMDKNGNVVSTTQSVNGWFGSGMVAHGTGIVMNNTMDDFSAKPGASNLYGAVGGDANSIAPGKTPLSSMAPTIVLKNDEPILAIGAPGGTRIISCVSQAILNFLGYGNSLYDSINAMRIHHQWKPDELDLDAPGPGPAAVKQLGSMGYNTIKMKPDQVACRLMGVALEGDHLVGVSDPSDHGSAAGI